MNTFRKAWHRFWLRRAIERRFGPLTWGKTLRLTARDCGNVGPIVHRAAARLGVITTMDLFLQSVGEVLTLDADSVDQAAIVREFIMKVKRLAPEPSASEADVPERLDGWELAIDRQGVPIVPYWEYLQSQHWQLLCAAWKVGRCARCKEHGRTDLHHLTYERPWSERPEDVIELCRDCHSQIHALPRAA